MLFFLRKSDGTLFYLLKDKEYTVGRKDCDILITNDQSISRKHAVLLVNADKVILRDCGSRYNTFVETAKVEANIDVILKNNYVVRFGVLQSNYTFHEVNLITTTSSIKSSQKATLRNNMEFLGGSLIQDWTRDCTHVTVEKIMLTVKVLCAIILGTPIVTLKYWEDYISNIKQNLPPPDATNFKPPCSEIIINYENLCLDYKEERRKLFENKTFVFPTKKEKDKMVDMIKLAGGDAISWDTSPVTKDEISKSSREYIILQTSEFDEKPNSELLDIIAFIRQKGKRTVPLQDIALAIITCSCEQHCNPDFDRKEAVFVNRSQTQSQTYKNILAHATESQSQQLFLPISENIKAESIIPASLDEDLKIESVEIKDLDLTLQSSDVKEVEDVRSVKREGDSIESLNVSKKFKAESSSTSGNKRKKFIIEDSESLEIKDELEEQPPKKSLFAFKNDKPTNEDGNPGPSNVVINPFAKKRRLPQNDNESASKKSNNANSFTSSGSSFFTPRSEPPSNSSVLKSRNPIKPPADQQKQQKAHNVIASSTVNNSQSLNSFQSELSRIEAVDSGLERSFGWLSRGSHNNSGGKKQLDCNQSIDEIEVELLKYIESFKNTVIIEEEPLVVRRPSVTNNNNDESCINNNVKNFKLFKKVQPAKEQTRIISSYVDIVCSDKTSHQVVDEPEEADEDDDMDMQINMNNARKRIANRFRL